MTPRQIANELLQNEREIISLRTEIVRREERKAELLAQLKGDGEEEVATGFPFEGRPRRKKLDEFPTCEGPKEDSPSPQVETVLEEPDKEPSESEGPAPIVQDPPAVSLRPTQARRPTGRGLEKLRSAMAWLRTRLSSGPAMWAQLLREAKAVPIGKTLLTEARTELNLFFGRKRYQGRVYVWLPGTETEMKAERRPPSNSPDSPSSTTKTESPTKDDLGSHHAQPER